MVVDKTNTFSLMRLESSGHRTLQAAVTEQPRGMGKELNQLQWGKQTYYRPAKAWIINKLINDLMNELINEFIIRRKFWAVICEI